MANDNHSTEPSTAHVTLADVLNAHRPSDYRSEAGTPMCSCGHDLGWDQTWGAHVEGILRNHLTDALQPLADAATPGPWRAIHNGRGADVNGPGGGMFSTDRADAEFIVASVDLVRGLLVRPDETHD